LERSTQPPDIFAPVVTGRISQDIVARIEAGIKDGTLSPGDRLPPERDLTARFGVSRVTVRDALRILEAKGLIEIRVGAGGGAFITSPAPQLVAEGIANMLLLSEVSAGDVTEARFVFELGMLPLVCARATADDLTALTAICDRSEEALAAGDYDVGFSSEFHSALARCVHNPAIDLIIDSFQGSLLASLREARAAAPEMGSRGVREHRSLVAAVAKRDLGRARAIMQRHLTRTARRLGRPDAPDTWGPVELG
jgi:GntR family transcriptional repressor for pyruvate dehydrogenase complex